MPDITDCFGRRVRLTVERRAHILEHPEMSEMAGEIEQTLREPEQVRQSRSDSDVKLFYRYYLKTLAGGKWLCVVVKYSAEDAFVITAYLTDKPKAGETLWPRR